MPDRHGITDARRKKSVGRYDVEFSSKLSKQLDVVARSHIQDKQGKYKTKPGRPGKKAAELLVRCYDNKIFLLFEQTDASYSIYRLPSFTWPISLKIMEIFHYIDFAISSSAIIDASSIT